MKAIRAALLLLLAIVLPAVVLPVLADQHKNQLKGFNPENVYSVHDIDAINTFNGNLTLTIPIGQEYPVAEGFSYRLVLYGNSNIWDSQVVHRPEKPTPHSARSIRTNTLDCDRGDGITIAHPHRRANAGLGWTLTLGRLYPSGDPSRDGAGGWMYESPDGSEHVFYEKLHDSDPAEPAGVTYTTDGTYLRMIESSATERVIEFPDGSIHTFAPSPTGRGAWLPSSLKHHGSDQSVTLTYPMNPDGTFDWQISDSHNRHHTIHFAKKFWDGGWKALVTSVDLAAFSSSDSTNVTAHYQFNYRETVIGRTEWHERCDGFENGARIQLLESVQLPDASQSSYLFAYNESTAFITSSGLPVHVTLPTGGVVQWDWTLWSKPVHSANDDQAHFTNSWGVGKRHRKLTVTGPPIATWEYKLEWDGDFQPNSFNTPREMRTLVIEPEAEPGNERGMTVSYFSVATDDDEDGWIGNEYGKPFTKNKDDGAGKWLSQEQYKGIEIDPGMLLRSTYVKYESESYVQNYRVAATRVVSHDDRVSNPSPTDPLEGAQWTETVNSDFDGLGHYRTSIVNGSTLFPAGSRTTVTNYNPTRGSLPGVFSMIPAGESWIVGTFSSVDTTEGTGTSRSDYCFNATNGRLEAVRTVRGPDLNDLLVVYKDDHAPNVAGDGNTDAEKYAGGDDVPAPPAGCVSDLANPSYRLNHTYASGVRQTTSYAGTSFNTLDLDIDRATGLPRKSRDSAGIETTYDYNALGQLLSAHPAGQAKVEYEYHINPTGTPHASVIARQWPSDGSHASPPLTEERYYYDAFGRLVQRRRRMPDAGPLQQWTVTEVDYDGAGHKTQSSVPVIRTSGDYTGLAGGIDATRFAYDALGRVKKTTQPDGKISETKYKGTRRILRSIEIATKDHPQTTVWNAEEYDSHGRLVAVIENTDADNDDVHPAGSLKTAYKYDVGNRLKEVVSGIQKRTFTYDGAGLLREEEHPELATTYYRYDARGHIRSKIVSEDAPTPSIPLPPNAAVALGFNYDAAERLLSVKDKTTGQDLKVFTYDTNGKGRLATQTRYNRFPEFTYTVQDTLTYDATSGLPHAKATDVTRVEANGTVSSQLFTQQYDYTDLGAPKKVNFPTCPTCSNVASNPRELELTYDNGLLTGIEHVTAPTGQNAGQNDGITYTAAGAVHHVQHAKANGQPGVMDIFEPDPDGMARVSSITFDHALPPVCEPPTIDPGSHTTGPDVPIRITVTAGGSEPRSYEWYLGTSVNPANLVSTDDFYETTLTTSTDFFVRITNACGQATSPVPVTVVCNPPSITVPDRAPTTENTSAHLVVNGSGTATLHYHWYRGVYPITTAPVGTDSPSYDTDPLSLTDPANYWVEVTNVCGADHASIHVTVVPCSAPFDIQAAPAVFVEGAPFQLSVPGGTAGTIYRWYRGTGAQRTFLAETTGAHYDITAGIAEETVYSVEKQSGTCTSTSNNLVIEPCLYKRAIRKTVVEANYKLSVVDDQPGVTFQWYEGTNHLDLTKPRGNGSYTYVPRNGPTHYWVRMSHVCNTVATVLDADIDLSENECLPEIFVQPLPASAVLGPNQTVSASVTAGGAGPFSYQWYVLDVDNGNETPIDPDDEPSAKTATYTWKLGDAPGATPRSKWVLVEVTQGSDPGSKTGVPSNAVLLAFSATPQRIADTAGNITVTNPRTHPLIYVTMEPVGPEHHYTYAWYRDDGTPEGERLLGQTQAAINVSASPIAAYWVEVRGTHNAGTSSEYREMTISPKMVVQVSSACELTPLRVDQSLHEICLDRDTYESPLVTFRAFNEADEVTYQWYEGQSGDTRDELDADPGKPYQLTLQATAVHKVWVRASRQCWMPEGSHQDSPTLYFTRGDCTPLFINQTIAPIEVEWGADTQIVFQPIAGLATPAYHWYKQGATPEAPGITVAGTASTLQLPDVTKSWRYWVHVRNTECSNSGSSTFPTLVRVASAPGMTPPNWQTEVWWNSDSPSGASLNALTGGGERYEWFQGEILDETHRVKDSAEPTFTTPILTADTRYWVRVHGLGGRFIDSPTITVKVCNPPKLTAAQEALLNTHLEVNVFANQLAVFFIPITEPANGSRFTYQWYRGVKPDESHPINDDDNNDLRLEVHPAATTRYWFRASTSCGGNNPPPYESPTFTAHVCAMPVIGTQPTALPTRIFAGSSSVLTVAATVTTEGPLTYQWYAGEPGMTNAPVVGGTSASITVSPTTDTMYWVRVTTGVCMVDSEAVTVSMCSYPQSVTLPANVNIAYEESTTLYFPIMYPLNQAKFTIWYRGEAGDRSHSVYYSASSTSPDFTTPSLTATTKYWMEFQHLGCTTSSTATTVNVCKPTITETGQPVGATIANGSSWTMTVGTTPIPGQTFQWYTGMPGNTSNPVVGEIGPSITVSPTTTTSYWVRVKGTCTPEAWIASTAATVLVCNPPAITSVSPTRYVQSGQQTSVSVTATGSNLTYQWYVGTSGTTTSPISGQTYAMYPFHPTATKNYWCRVTSEGFCFVNGPTIAVEVCTPPAITQQPLAVPTKVFPGNSSTLSVAATAAGPISYQWYAGAPGETASPVAGGTTASIAVSPTADTSYWVRVTTSVCTTDSEAVTVTMCSYPQSVTLPANVNIAYEGSTTLQFPLLYPLNQAKFTRWYRGEPGDRTALVAYSSSSTSYDFTTPALTATTKYWMEFEHLGCLTMSTATTVSVCKPTVTGQPVGTTISNGSSWTMTVGTTPIPGQTFQWYTGTPGNTSSPVAGATSASITVSPTTTTSYWVRVKGTCVPEATTDSVAATVTVCNPPLISSVSPTQYIQQGQQTAVIVSAGGSNLTYQWYVGASGNTSSPISGATSPYRYVTPASTTNYWCRVTAEGLCSTNSATATVDVCALPVITQQPIAVPDRIFPGSSSTLSVAATANGAITYQWYVGASGVTTAPIAGATAATLTVSPTVETSYWVRVTTRVCSTDSAAMTVSICTFASGVTLPATRDIAYGESVMLPFPTMSPANQSKVIRWYRGAAGDRSNLVAGGTATSLNYTTPSLTTNTQYWMEFEHLGCLTTSTATLVRVCKPTITVPPQNGVILAGNSQTLTVTATGSPLTYQWYIGSSGVTTQPIGGATSSSLTVTPSATTTYWVRATGCSTSADSAAATVTVCTAPTITNLTKTSTYAIGSSGSITVTATGTNLVYQWFKGQSGDTSLPINGATSATYNFTLQTSQYYWVRVTSTCNNSTVNSAALLYSVAPHITVHPADVTISRGTTATLSVTATGTLLTYQWYTGNSALIAGATSPTYTTPPLSTGVNEYWCEVKSGTIGINSGHAFITLCDGPYILSFNTTYHVGSTYRLTVTLPSSQYPLVRYYWYSGVPGNVSQSTSLGEGSNQQYFSVTTSTTYWVRVWFADDSCYTDSPGKTLP